MEIVATSIAGRYNAWSRPVFPGVAMAKCPKCERRKGKRYCPALERNICSPCCAEHRLQSIPCPQDCPHLKSEHYQLGKRRQRANTTGKKFVHSLSELFVNSDSREFAFTMQADTYWWMRQNGRLENEPTASAFEEVKSRLSPVYVPSTTHAGLADFLWALVDRGKRHSRLLSGAFTARRRIDAIAALGRHVRVHARRFAAGRQDATYSYHQELEDYFGHLDFEADLDYSPAEELPRQGRDGAPGGFREHSSGLYVPGG